MDATKAQVFINKEDKHKILALITKETRKKGTYHRNKLKGIKDKIKDLKKLDCEKVAVNVFVENFTPDKFKKHL